MRIVIQRVSRAAVSVEDQSPRSIGAGVVVLLGLGPGDDTAMVRKWAEKTAHLRIFSNAEGKFDKSLLETGGQALVVSQFTLYGDTRKGRRPDFTGALAPELAEPLYQDFVAALKELGIVVKTGEFGAKMSVELVNEGPVTLLLDSA
jgi:D-tyrosyl-tRNA(Tyr) deacylase